MECNVDAMVVKLLSSSFTNAITQCIDPNFESSDSSQISILHPLVSFTLNKSTLTCIGVQEWFKKFVTRAKMSTPSLNIQRSKLMEIIVTNVRFGNTCKFFCFFFFPIARSTSSTSTVQEGNYETQGHWCKINLINQFL